MGCAKCRQSARGCAKCNPFFVPKRRDQFSTEPDGIRGGEQRPSKKRSTHFEASSIAAILEERHGGWGHEYRIVWEGVDKATWESAAGLEAQVGEALRAFKNK